jgi:hypothetical protein
MSYKRKICRCGHNKRVHGYYFGCSRCDCQVFHRKQKGEK